MKSTVLMILSVMFATVACAEDDACGEGMKEAADGTCAAASGGSAGAPATSGEFGATCAEHADCTGDTTYCATPPGAAPYCTVSGCDADSALCPAEWLCFDVSQFVPGEPWICVPPL